MNERLLGVRCLGTALVTYQSANKLAHSKEAYHFYFCGLSFAARIHAVFVTTREEVFCEEFLSAATPLRTIPQPGIRYEAASLGGRTLANIGQ